MTEAVWLAIVAAVGALLTSIVTSFTTLKGKKFESSNNEIKQLIEQNTKHTQEGQERITAVTNTLSEYIKQRAELDETYKEALRILLRQNIDEMYQLYYLKEKCMSHSAKEELDETFSIYKSLGGNHIGEKRYLKMLELPEPEELKDPV